MDYKKEYEEIVQRVKELHESGNALTKKQMEIIFPELRESEDEKIRKDIMVAVENWHTYERVEEIRFYLREQKEQKDYRKLYEEVVNSDWFKENYKGKSLGEEKQKEQKPVENSGKELLYVSNKSYNIGFRDGKMAAEQKTAEWSEEQKPELVQHPAIGYMYNADAGRGEQLKQAVLALLKSDLIQVAGRGFTKTALIEWVETRPAEIKENEK